MNASSLHTTFADLTRTLQNFAEPRIVDLLNFARSHPCAPSNFGWMLTAAHVGEMETISTVKARLEKSIPDWETAARNGHWSAVQSPSRVRSAKAVLAMIEEFEGVR